MKSFFTGMFLLILLVFTRCNKNKFHEMDPAIFPPASFSIGEVVGDTLSYTDTALTYNNIILKPVSRYDSIKWDINGIQTKRDSMIIYFMQPGEYVIKMTSYRYQYPLPGLIKDSITRHLYILPRESAASYLGDFKGILTGSESDTFTISIYRILQDLPSYSRYTHILSNLPKGCLSIDSQPMAPLTTLFTGYRMFYTDAPRCFPASKCIGTYQAGKIVVDYSVIDTSKPFNPVTGQYVMIPKRFTGYRL